jgi:hypothetical protein
MNLVSALTATLAPDMTLVSPAIIEASGSAAAPEKLSFAQEHPACSIDLATFVLKLRQNIRCRPACSDGNANGLVRCWKLLRGCGYPEAILVDNRRVFPQKEPLSLSVARP